MAMKTHHETRLLPYSPEQMFNLVADVSRYPEFLPWCLGARIREQQADMLLADLMIGFKMVREKFTSKVWLDRSARRIDVEYINGPFRQLENRWRFRPDGEGCNIDFFISYEFRSRALGLLMGSVFDAAFRKFSAAFEKRADVIYGTPRPA